MKATARKFVFTLILVAFMSIEFSAQVSETSNAVPVTVFELLEVFKLPYKSGETYESANRKASDLLKKRCDVDFRDDGTNYWALQMAGATEDLIKKIDKCRSPERTKEINKTLQLLSDRDIHVRQKDVMRALIYVIYENKTLEARGKFVEAGKEYIKRYKDDPYGDPGTDVLLAWLLATLPKIGYHQSE